MNFANNTGYDLKAEQKDGLVTITSRGKAAHGSTPEKGKNAIMQLLAFLGTLETGLSDVGNAIKFMNENVGMETDGRSFGLAMSDDPSGNLTLNVGMINMTQDQVVFDLDLRYPVTFELDDIMKPFNRTVEGSGFEAEIQSNQIPLYSPRKLPLIETLSRIYSDETGRDGQPIAIGGSTYAESMPNIVAFGPLFPGDPDVEHQPDEYIPIDDLVLDAKIYARAIYELAK